MLRGGVVELPARTGRTYEVERTNTRGASPRKPNKTKTRNQQNRRSGAAFRARLRLKYRPKTYAMVSNRTRAVFQGPCAEKKPRVEWRALVSSFFLGLQRRPSGLMLSSPPPPPRPSLSPAAHPPPTHTPARASPYRDSRTRTRVRGSVKDPSVMNFFGRRRRTRATAAAANGSCENDCPPLASVCSLCSC